MKPKLFFKDKSECVLTTKLPTSFERSFILL